MIFLLNDLRWAWLMLRIKRHRERLPTNYVPSFDRALVGEHRASVQKLFRLNSETFRLAKQRSNN